MILAHAALVEHSATAVGLIVVVAVYLAGHLAGGPRRRSRHPLRAVAFCAGIGALLVVSSPGFESWAEATFTRHMVQHLVVYAVVPPLLVAAHPITTITPILPHRLRTVAGRLKHRVRPPASTPVRSAAAFVIAVVVLYGLHLTSVYDRALADTTVHLATHLALLAAGLAIWSEVLRPGVADGALRVGFALASGVPLAFLGMALTSASHPLSHTYVDALGEADALADQQAGGALMWIGAMLAGALLAVIAVWRWASLEQTIADRIEGSTDRLAGRGQMVGMVKVTVDPDPGADSIE